MGHSLSTGASPGTTTLSNEEEKMRSPKERAKAAVLGAFVADAASMPLHRIYDQGAIEALLRGGETAAAQVAGSPGSDDGGQRTKTTPCEFFSPCSCPFYTLPPGQSTPYGKEAFPILYSISSCGVFDKERASQLLFECMRGIDVSEDCPSSSAAASSVPAAPVRAAVSEAGSVESGSSGESRSGSSLDKSRLESADDFDAGASSSDAGSPGSTRYAAQLQADYRLNPKMLSTTSRQFLQARARGLSWDEFAAPHAAALDAQGMGLVKVPLIVARYAGSHKLIPMVESCVRIHQTSEAVLVVCRLAARLLERVVLGMTVTEALRWALAGGGKITGASDTSSSSTSSSSSSASATAALADAMPENERWYLRRVLKTTGFGSAGTPAPCPFSVTAEGLGLDGQLPGCFLTTLAALHVFKDYKTALRANMVAGGDSALRAWIIGSMLAAEGSEIPLAWKDKTVLYQEVLILATRVVGSNPAFDRLKEVNFCRVTL
jgi:hypothetical protein